MWAAKELTAGNVWLEKFCVTVQLIPWRVWVPIPSRTHQSSQGIVCGVSEWENGNVYILNQWLSTHQRSSAEHEKQHWKDSMSIFYGHSEAFRPYTVCGCTESDTWSTGLLVSLQLVAVQEFTISIKFESSNIETRKLQLNNPVGIYLLSVSVWERLCARNF